MTAQFSMPRFAGANAAPMAAIQALTAIGLDATSRLAALHLDTARLALENTASNTRALVDDSLETLRYRPPGATQALAYWRQLAELSSGTRAVMEATRAVCASVSWVPTAAASNTLAEQTRQQKRLHDLSRRLVAIHEEERRHLAAELHEQVAPNLAAARINLHVMHGELQQALPGGVTARLSETQALLDDTDASIRQLGVELRPSVLDFAGLVPALESYAEQFARRTGIAVHFIGSHPATRLALDIESMLFRIAQEALANCAKHAEARSVSIELIQDAPHWAMTIADDGVGFDPQRLGETGRAHGLGLLTMRERAEFIGGKLHIDSYPGQGTRVTVEI